MPRPVEVDDHFPAHSFWAGWLRGGAVDVDLSGHVTPRVRLAVPVRHRAGCGGSHLPWVRRGEPVGELRSGSYDPFRRRRHMGWGVRTCRPCTGGYRRNLGRLGALGVLTRRGGPAHPAGPATTVRVMVRETADSTRAAIASTPSPLSPSIPRREISGRSQEAEIGPAFMLCFAPNRPGMTRLASGHNTPSVRA